MELLDIVNEHDEPIGKAMRPEIYAAKHRHRIAHIIVFNTAGEMGLQKRSMHVSYCPGHWSVAAGGHVLSGESYEQAAVREAHEEIGLDASLSFLAKDTYANDGLTKFLVTFTAVSDGPFTHHDGEAEELQFFAVEEIKQMIARGEPFHPELVFLLQKQF